MTWSKDFCLFIVTVYYGKIDYYFLHIYKNIGKLQEYVIRVQRGPLKENSWQIIRRYSDFVNLDAQLKISQIELPLPPKKVFGNFDRDFIAVRQNGLQVSMHFQLFLTNLVYVLGQKIPRKSN